MKKTVRLHTKKLYLTTYFQTFSSFSLFCVCLVTEWIISCRGHWNSTLNPELPFLLPSKIFMRTIRSSDKMSTEDSGARGKEGRMLLLFSNTLYPHHRAVFINLWPDSRSLHPESSQALMRMWQSAILLSSADRLCSVLSSGHKGAGPTAPTMQAGQ